MSGPLLSILSTLTYLNLIVILWYTSFYYLVLLFVWEVWGQGNIIYKELRHNLRLLDSKLNAGFLSHRISADLSEKYWRIKFCQNPCLSGPCLLRDACSGWQTDSRWTVSGVCACIGCRPMCSLVNNPRTIDFIWSLQRLTSVCCHFSKIDDRQERRGERVKGTETQRRSSGQPQGQWLRLPRVTEANSQADEGLGGK